MKVNLDLKCNLEELRKTLQCLTIDEINITYKNNGTIKLKSNQRVYNKRCKTCKGMYPSTELKKGYCNRCQL